MSTRGGRDCSNERKHNNSCCLGVYFCNQKEQSVIRAQISYIWRVGSFLSTLVPTNCVQAVLEMHAVLPTIGLVDGEGVQLLLCHKLKWIKINYSLPSEPSPWNLQGSNRFQSSKTFASDRFRQRNCYLGGRTYSWCFLPCHRPRILWYI